MFPSFRSVIAGVAVALACAGCPAASDEVQVADQFYFPTGAALSEGGAFLLVTNANSDLRFDSGSLALVDLALVEQAVSNWLSTGAVADGCAPDPAAPASLRCDEPGFILANETRRIGNFAGLVKLQTLADGSQRAYIPVRGDPSVVWVDIDPVSGAASCDDSGGFFARCDANHRITRLFNDSLLRRISIEPFGIHVDSGNQFVAVSHLDSGDISLIEAPADGGRPALVDIAFNALGGASNGQRGSVDIAGRTPGAPNEILYAGSRVTSRVQTFTLGQLAADSNRTLSPSDFFILDAIPPASESRAMVFSAGGDRLHIVNRNPASLITVDTSLDGGGRPLNEVLGAVEVCSRASSVSPPSAPSNVAVGDFGEGERAFVTCFRAGTVWSINLTTSRVDAITSVGRGPNDIVVDASRRLLYVTNFLDDSVAVIDVEPGSATENETVLILGLGPSEF